MSLAKRRYSYVDFTSAQSVPLFAKTTHAIATPADNQEDYFHIDGNYFELIQTGQNDVIPDFVKSATGWVVPLDTATDGIEITQGMAAGVATPMQFVVGTDAFFIKVKAEVTTLANIAHFGVGFRVLAAYANIGTAAEAITAYDDKIMVKAVVTSGITSYTHSVGAVDTSKTITGSPIVTGTAVTWEVRVDADGLCTALVDGTADTIFNADALSLTSALVMVPSISAAGNATGASSIELVTYECGLLP